MYQFPIGKVKTTQERQKLAEEHVSIPYGKGKGYSLTQINIPDSVYQFPMGKVKKGSI